MENNSRKNLVELKKQAKLDEVPVYDELKEAVEVLLKGIPVIGGSLAYLIHTTLPNLWQKRVSDFLHEIAVEVEKVKDNVDKSIIEREEFSYIFEKTIRSVMQNYQKEKIECFKAILIHSLIPTDIKTEEKEFFLNLVNEMTVTHIKILHLLYDPDAFNKKQGNRIKNGGIGSRMQIFSSCFPELTEPLLRTALSDLDSKGLTRVGPALNITISGTDISKLTNLITDFGKKFINFITLET